MRKTIEYYPDGQTVKTIHMLAKSGLGVDEEYFPNGRLAQRCILRNGRKNGSFKVYDQEEGRLIGKGMFKDDKKNGVFKFYPEDGRLMKCVYKDDKLNGPYFIFERNCQLLERGWYKDGKRHGSRCYYYKNGILFMMQSYKNGLLDGLCQIREPDGRLREEIVFEKGKKISHRKISEIAKHVSGAVPNAGKPCVSHD